jgi:glycosyltransferase involved in cell wall biosynthesis
MMSRQEKREPAVVSVIIPARNEGAAIAGTVRAVLSQEPHGTDLEVIVVDDGSTDDTGPQARRAGARVVEASVPGSAGNPGAARNKGAVASKGDPIIFLDADCLPKAGWLDAMLSAHSSGAVVVGGALSMPAELSFIARCDYYCGWYLVHPRRPAGNVPHHPPPNLSVRRGVFFETSGFSEMSPLGQVNEERVWEGEIRKAGHPIFFEPRAVVDHYNRPGVGNLLRRNYRWGYTALESKSMTGSARMAWLYRFPLVLILTSPLVALAHTGYILACWIHAGRWEPVAMFPWVLASRCAYVLGMTVGGVQWMRHRRFSSNGPRPSPPW